MARKARRTSKSVQVGDRFNRYTVIGPSYKANDGSSVFPVECDCGSLRFVKFRYLGVHESCGCYQKEVAHANTKHGMYVKGKEASHADAWRWKMYGMPQESYQALREEQLGLCAICLDPLGEGKEVHVDHDHTCCSGQKTCGKCVRGLLCSFCNRGIGQLREDPDILQRAVLYLEQSQKVVV